jgi:hypothetical protein
VDQVRCPHCDQPAAREREGIPLPGGNYLRPVYSDSLGVHPSQVEEHRRRFPDIPITDQGQVIFRNHYERKRILKKLGYIDRDSYC